MSQYPSPYQPPPPPGGSQYPSQYPMNYGFVPPSDPLAPAKRAAIMMYVIGALTLLLSLCAGMFVAMLPQMMQNPQFAEQMSQIPGLDRETLAWRTGITAVVGIAFIVLGLMVSRGGLGSTIVALILSSLLLLFEVLGMVATLAMARGAPGSMMASMLCGGFVPTVLFTILIFMLIQAARASGQVRAMRDQQMSQQAQQQYWQYGHPPPGYQPPPPGYQPPPPPPPPRPPDAPH